MKTYEISAEFEAYLQEVHGRDYMGADDDMPDAFDHWLAQFDEDELREMEQRFYQTHPQYHG